MDDEKELPELDTPDNGDDKEGKPDSPDTPDEEEAEVNDDVEGDAEASEEDGGPDEEAPPAKSRASDRVRSLANERKAAAERAERAEAENARLRSQMEAVQRQMAGQKSEADLRAEAELLATMDPVQRVQYESDKKIENLQREIQNVRMATADNNDKAQFLSKVATDPIRAKYVEKVETALAEMRAKGVNAPRDDIYYYMLGKSFAQSKAKGGNKTADKVAATKRVSAVQGKSASARSDTQRTARGKSLEDRLENVVL